MAIGFFDGVHLGHQAILRGADAALTFRNHPLTVLAPERAPRLIMSCEERVAAIKACGVKDVTVLDFTRELADMPAEKFVDFLVKRKGFRFSAVRCGANWRFGKGGAGDAEFLRKLGLEVEVAAYAEYKGEPISSSRIRRCLENGEIDDANAMLGRRFQVSGLRFQGKGLGGKIGYPTINLEVYKHGFDEFNGFSRILLKRGVYEVEVDGVKGVANYGLAPTLGDQAWTMPILEIHLLGAGSEDVRLKTEDMMTALFIRYVRPEKKFDSIDDLKRQIAADCAKITP